MFSIGLALAGAVVAVTVSGGFSGSLHSVFGLSTVTLGVFAGRGGLAQGHPRRRNYYTADPNESRAPGSATITT